MEWYPNISQAKIINLKANLEAELVSQVAFKRVIEFDM